VRNHVELDHFHSAAGSSKSARDWEAHTDSFMPKVRANEWSGPRNEDDAEGSLG
jgi:hypothetical protein